MKEIQGLKMYDSSEVCIMLGINSQTLIGLRRKGLIRSIRIGRYKYTSEECLRDYLNAKTAPKKRRVKKDNQNI